MSVLQRFMFEGLPVRGMLVRLTDAWQELQQRHRQSGAYPAPVLELLGEMSAAALLMQANIKFNGSLVLQMFGAGPVRVAVAESQPDLGFRATATVDGDLPEGVGLSTMVNGSQPGRCAITLDPKDRQPGQQPYQGVVPLIDEQGQAFQRLSEVLEHYMRQSEQLDTRLVLAADGQVAAGLLIQRLPRTGVSNLAGHSSVAAESDALDADEDFNRIALLAASLQRDELLGLDPEQILHRLFWQEDVRLWDAQAGDEGPHFSCTCSRDKVAGMLQGLGRDEIESVLAEQGHVEVGCQFCGMQYRFDPVDAAALFLPAVTGMPSDHRPQLH